METTTRNEVINFSSDIKLDSESRKPVEVTVTGVYQRDGKEVSRKTVNLRKEEIEGVQKLFDFFGELF